MRNIITLTIFCTLLSGILPAQSVTPWLTSGDQSSLLAPQPTVEFGDQIAPAPATITLNADNTFQSIDGFGFALTQASAFVIREMDSEKREELLNKLFGADGIAMEAVRISIGASDLSTSLFSYNDTPGDLNMDNFSLEGPDLVDVIPVLKQILAINQNIKVLATPWSAPRWMKTNNSFVGGSLRPDRYDAYARYFVKYLEAMDAEDITIWAITPQNEPENQFNDPSMLMSASEQLDFINNHLGPQIANSPYSPKIIAFDHNCDNPDYPIQVLNGSNFVDGAAFHLYDNPPAIETMSVVRNATNKNVYFTEQFTSSNGSFNGDFDWHMRNVMIGALSNWSRTVFQWNLAANPQQGPRTPGGCSTCLPAVTVSGPNSFSFNVSYYLIAQVSQFIRSNAVRVETSNNNSSLYSVGFTNPDGTRVLLAYNEQQEGLSVRIRDNGAAFDYTIPGRSAITFVWTPGPDNNTPFESMEGVTFPFAGSPVVLPGIVEAENFDLGGQDMAYSDNDPGNIGGQYRDEGVDIENASEGGQNVGWTDSDEWLTYSVDVAQAGIYDLTLRVASATNTGQVSILFDGNDKTGVVDVSSTGGWQTWDDLVIANVALDAGPQVMRINILSGGFNLNRITVSEVITTNDPGLAGFYNIISRSSGKGLDVADNSTSNNANVQQYDVNNGGGDNQRWEFDLLNDGYYAIKAKHSGLCLTQSNSSPNVLQLNCNNWNRQQWQLTDIGDGFFTLRNKFSNEFLQVKNNSTNNGANIQVGSSNGNFNQQWRFEQVETGASGRLAGTQVPGNASESVEQIKLFPNPVENELTIKLPQVHDFSSVTVCDGGGRQLLVLPVQPEMIKLEMELGNLPAGMYTIHFTSPSQPVVRRLIKN